MKQMDFVEVREKFPQYNDVSDIDLADRLHAKFYSKIPRSQFDQSIGFDRDKAQLVQMAGGRPQFTLPEPPKKKGLAGLRENALEFLGDAAETPAVPGLAGKAGQFLAGAGEAILREPVSGLGLDAPSRATGALLDASGAVSQGDLKEAGSQGISALTALGETGLLIAPGAGTVGRQATNQVRRESSEFLADAAAQQVDPRLATRFPRVAGGVTKAVSDNPLTAGAVVGQANKALGQLEEATARAARQFGGNDSVNTAGRVALDGAERFANKRTGTKGPGSTFRDQSDRLFEKAVSSVNMDAIADFTATRTAVSEIKGAIKNNTLRSAERNPQVQLIDDIIRETDIALAPEQPLSRADELLQQALSVQSQKRATGSTGLADFVRQSGGVRDPGGDVLSAIGGTVKGRPGLVNNTGGRQLDELITAAQEAGYFPGRNAFDDQLTPNEFLDALSDDLAGKRVFRETDIDDVAQNRIIDRLEDELAREGVSASVFGRELIDQVEAATGEKVTSAATTAGPPASLSDLRRLRTRVRRAQKANVFDRSIDDGELKRLEVALTDDIYTNIAANGGQTALRRAKQADKFYREGKKSIGVALQPFLRKGQTEEGAFRSIIAAAKQSKDGGDIQRIRTLRRSLKPEELREVSSGIVANLGKPRGGGEFSPLTFSREFNTLDAKAKDAIFGRDTPARKNLEQLARVVEREASVEALTNRSHSGSVVAVAGTAGLASVNALAAIGGLAGSAAMGRLLLSPSFTKAVLKVPKAADDIGRNAVDEFSQAGALGADRARIIAILAAVEQADDGAADIARELRREIDANQRAQSQQQAVSR